ncbi:uncharacterized protein LOC102721635 [Oryza brachyantha]|uniref:uncharacterized protein LOC102721635 n=1 Tax=Oryza brachyantha TaxID=4533 RepID=UPI001ADA1A95|nr:uncharacterized protein LOC102721635 [Oryza brachyantha]
MRPVTFAAAVLVVICLTSGGGGGGRGGTAARPLAVGAAPGTVAVELAGTGTNASSQPSNCTYGNNVGGQCPPTPGAGH